MEHLANPSMTADGLRADSTLNREFPSRLFIETTARCNLQCGVCVRQSRHGGTMTGDLSRETFTALEPVFPYLDAVVLNGIGEPLLHPHLEEFITRAKKLLPHSAWVGFQTNGVLLDHERATSLIEAGLDRICLSLDAISSERFRMIRAGSEVGDMKRAFSALNKAKTTCGRPDVRIGMEFVLMRQNLSELPGTLRWAAEHGASFAIVTQLLPYDRRAAEQAVYDTNTAQAIAVYERWKAEAEREGLALQRYGEIFMKYWKSENDLRMFDMVERMKVDAASQDITLHIEKLFKRDEAWFRRVDAVLAEAGQIAETWEMDLKLPELAPQNSRRCDFVEAGSIFVSWDGRIHPCYFLWHRYSCFVGGWEKQVKPWVFGDLSEQGIMNLWDGPQYRSFRESVLHYDFPFCFDCGFALCDYVQGEDFIQDCYVSSVPCGACLWCTGLFHCLQ